MLQNALRLTLGLTISIIAHSAVLFFEPGRLDASSIVIPTSLNLVLLPPSSVLSHENQETKQAAPESKPTVDALIPAEINQMDTLSKEGIFKANIDDYVPSNLLTSRPRPWDSIELTIDYLKIDNLIGEATVLILISAEGVVDSVLVIDSSLPDVLVDYAVDKFKNTKFVPGFINEYAVRSQFLIKLGTPSAESIAVTQPKSVKQAR